MKLGWLWLSILNTMAWLSPKSTTPAFSPGPWITLSPVVGSVFSHFFEDLYEQCSFHMADTMPSSVLGAAGRSNNHRLGQGLAACRAGQSEAGRAGGIKFGDNPVGG
jgi:hypothetical protein